MDTGGCQVQDLALGVVEPHVVHMGPLLKLVQVPLDGILSFLPWFCLQTHVCMSHFSSRDVKGPEYSVLT